MNQLQFIAEINNHYRERYTAYASTVTTMEHHGILKPVRNGFRRNPEYSENDLRMAILAIDTKLALGSNPEWQTIRELLGSKRKSKES